MKRTGDRRHGCDLTHANVKEAIEQFIYAFQDEPNGLVVAHGQQMTARDIVIQLGYPGMRISTDSSGYPWSLHSSFAMQWGVLEETGDEQAEGGDALAESK